jgi:hypothetical protein
MNFCGEWFFSRADTKHFADRRLIRRQHDDAALKRRMIAMRKIYFSVSKVPRKQNRSLIVTNAD